MFGYVRAFVPELRVREHEYYRGTYCGLCKAMGRCTGQCSRLSLSYDFVMFSILRFALVGEIPSFSQKRCALHPLKKRNIMNPNSELEHSAYASALLTYRKVHDDISDEGFSKRLFSRVFLLPTAATMRKRTLRKSNKKDYTELDRFCADALKRLSKYEKNESSIPSVDEPAELFGSIVAKFLEFGLDGTKARIARSAGFHLGKWIYIADALDDIKEDEKLSRFNPFLKLFGRVPTKEEADGITVALKNELIGLEDALDLIDYGDNLTQKELIYNIIYLGMPKRIEEIVKKYSETEKDQNYNDRKDD